VRPARIRAVIRRFLAVHGTVTANQLMPALDRAQARDNLNRMVAEGELVVAAKGGLGWKAKPTVYEFR
jgi:hypothetical protein